MILKHSSESVALQSYARATDANSPMRSARNTERVIKALGWHSATSSVDSSSLRNDFDQLLIDTDSIVRRWLLTSMLLSRASGPDNNVVSPAQTVADHSFSYV